MPSIFCKGPSFFTILIWSRKSCRSNEFLASFAAIFSVDRIELNLRLFDQPHDVAHAQQPPTSRSG